LENRYMTVREAAALLNVSERTVRRLIASGDLAAIRIGRVLRVSAFDLNDFLAESREVVL
jgi:excisionase family DNA binding protein